MNPESLNLEFMNFESLNLESVSLLKKTLQKYSGDKSFSFSVQTPEAVSVTITPEEQINITSTLIEELEEILPHQALEFNYPSLKNFR